MQIIAGRSYETTRSYCENSVGTGNWEGKWRPEVGVAVLRNVKLYGRRRSSFAKGKRRKWVDGQRDRARLNYGVKCHWFPYHWVTKAAIVICLRWRSLATQSFPGFSLEEATTTLKMRLKGLWNWRMPRTHRRGNILNLWCLSRRVTTSTLLFQHLILKKNYEKPAKKIKAEEAKEFEKVAIDV